VNITELKRTWAHLPFTLQLLKFCLTEREKILLAVPILVKGQRHKNR